MSNSEIKICQNCQASFEIDASDFAFYAKISASGGSAAGGKVPAPTFCPECRAQRRVVWRNERNIYKRKCDFSGKEFFSPYSPDKPYKIYDNSVWYSDECDAMTHGRLGRQ